MEAWVLSMVSVFGVELFLTPSWLWLLWCLPFIWLLSRNESGDDWNTLRKGSTLKVKHSMLEQFRSDAQKFDEHSPKSWQKRTLWWVKNSLRMVVLALLIIILAEPVNNVKLHSEAPQTTQRDLVFVLESSASFLLPDYQQNGQSVSRMEAVKSVLEDFIRQLSGNRFGVVIYGEHAYSLLPLTSDASAAQISLQRLQPFLAGRTDEAMVEALGLALQATRSLSVDNDFENSSSTNVDNRPQKSPAYPSETKRVLVLISDGLSAQSPYAIEEAINLARQLKTPIYTVGVGAKDISADKRQFQGLIYQTLESESLQKIAEQTGGRYFHVGGSNELQEVFAEIDQLEGVPVSVTNFSKTYDSLRPQLIISLLVLLLSYFLIMVFSVFFRLRQESTRELFTSKPEASK